MSKNRASKSVAKKEDKSSKPSVNSEKTSMKTTEIRDLIDFISKTGLNEVNIETQQLKLHVKREPDQKVFKSTPVMAPMASAPVSTSMPTAQSSSPKAEKTVAETPGRKTAEIKSPMIGTFYRSAGPDSGPF